MIIVSTTAEDEARDVAEVLGADLPRNWSWRVFLNGREFRSFEVPAPSEVR